MKKLNGLVPNSDFFANIPLEMWDLIFSYLLPEELFALMQCNCTMHEFINSNVLAHKKINHFGELGANLDEDKSFKEWYQESYITPNTSKSFIGLNLMQRKLFSEVKEKLIPKKFTENLNLKDSYNYTLKEWAFIKHILPSSISMKNQEIKSLLAKSICNLHPKIIDEILPLIINFNLFYDPLNKTPWMNPENLEKPQNLILLAAKHSFLLLNKFLDKGVDITYINPLSQINIFHYASQNFTEEEYEKLINLLKNSNQLLTINNIPLHEIYHKTPGKHPVHYAAAEFNLSLLHYFKKHHQLNLAMNRPPYLTPLGIVAEQLPYKINKTENYEHILNTISFLVFNSDLKNRRFNHQTDKLLKFLSNEYAFFDSWLFSNSKTNPQHALFKNSLDEIEKLIIYIIEEIKDSFAEKDKIALAPLFGLKITQHPNIKRHLRLAELHPLACICTEGILLILTTSSFFIGLKMDSKNSFNLFILLSLVGTILSIGLLALCCSNIPFFQNFVSSPLNHRDIEADLPSSDEQHTPLLLNSHTPYELSTIAQEHLINFVQENNLEVVPINENQEEAQEVNERALRF